ncbi:MAG: hypothetical protein IPK03_02135 [Bacteroidetes bacterium]|nr:hypothetical protein [Bacteroidota bacterium]
MKYFFLLWSFVISSLLQGQVSLFSETFPNASGFANWNNIDLSDTTRPKFLMNAGQTGTVFTTQANGYPYTFANAGLTVARAYNTALWNKASIDCSGKPVVILKFEEVYNSNTQTFPGNLVYFDSTFIEVSKDSVNWVKFLVRTGGPIITGKKYVNISSEAANQSKVFIRFRSKGLYWYVWFLDDIDVIQPDSFDVKNNFVANPEYLTAGNINISTNVTNNGSVPITSLELTYTINGGGAQTATVTGLNILPLFAANVTHTILWNATLGFYNIAVTMGKVNGSPDGTPGDNEALKDVVVANSFVPRKPFFEVFTSSTNSFCFSGNVNYRNVIFFKNDTSYVDIKYQQDFPTNGDPYCTGEGINRRNVPYSINSIPRMEVNGGFDDITANFNETVYQNALNTPAAYELSGEYSIDTITKTINDIKIKYKPLLDMAPTFTKLFVAIVEKTTTANAKTNGETTFYNVLKKMVPNSNGITITTLTANTVDSLLTSYTFKGSYRLPIDGQPANRIDHTIEHSVENFNNLKVIAWVQNTSTRQVFQAANLNKLIKSIKVDSANGGEIWSVGYTKKIKWTSKNVNDVKIEYTINGGTSWNLIAASVPANTGSYNWAVPNTPSADCKIRITDVISPMATDESDNKFEIVYPITVTAPNGGETWTVGTSKDIIWNAAAELNNVKIEVSLNNGLSWSTVVASMAASTGFYSWTIPNTPSTNCLIRVTDLNNTTLFDKSNGTFTIALPPSLKLNAPNGGNIWNVNSNQNITWTAVTVQNIKIEYTINNGGSWNTIAGSVLASLGTYAWNLPNTPSTNCRVRITDINNGLINDESDSNFTIFLPPSITVTAPNGGESWNVGSSKNITWNSAVVNYVKLEYSVNGGGAWITIAPAVLASSGSYSWTIPNNPSANCLIKITDTSNTALFDVSNSVFSINTPTNITLTNPNGGEIWTAGLAQNITWSSSGINDIKIEYSTNGGTSWTTIISSTAAAAGIYSWTVPNAPSTNCKVRVTDILNSSNVDNSDGLFTIVLPPSVAVLSPNGGETWDINSNQNILWTSNSIADVKIEFTTNNGSSWNTITSSTPAAAGSYSWNVPNTPTTQAKVRISDATNITLIDASNSNFTIQLPTSITVTSPDGGETWDVGTNQNITFTSQNIANVKIDYSINGGASWINITASTPTSSGSYTWTIPNNASANCKVRISDASNANTKDESNGAFTIRLPATIALNAPNGGETWDIGTVHNITWTTTAINNIKIEFSSNSGGTWTTVAASVLASLGTYAWTIPGPTSNNCLIKITDVSNASNSDISNLAFKIVQPPSITITSPNGTESWLVGSSQNITWTTTGVQFVKIEYSTNNGLKWKMINPAILSSLGTYAWTIPDSVSTQCKIRLTSTVDSNLFALSNGNFKIYKAPVINSINSALDNQSSLIYPNPLFNQFNIQTNLSYDKVYVYDIRGGLMREFVSNKKHLYSIDELESGSYWIILIKDDQPIGKHLVQKQTE